MLVPARSCKQNPSGYSSIVMLLKINWFICFPRARDRTSASTHTEGMKQGNAQLSSQNTQQPPQRQVLILEGGKKTIFTSYLAHSVPTN